MMGQNLAVTPGHKSGAGNGPTSRSTGAGESVGSAFDQVLAGSANGGDTQQTSRADGKRPQPAQREITQRETAQREATRANRNASAERDRASAEAERSANEVEDRADSRLESDDDDDTDDDAVQNAAVDVFALLGLTPAAPPAVPPGFTVAAAAAVAAQAQPPSDSEMPATVGDDTDTSLALGENGADVSSPLILSATSLTSNGTLSATSGAASLTGSATLASLGTASPDIAADAATQQAAALSSATADSAALDMLARVPEGNGINVNAASSFATLAETMARSVAPQDAAPRHNATLHQQMGSQAWARELGAQVVFMAKDDLQTASLKLSPEHLGPVEVRIAVKDGEATVTFGATHADTRAALEQSLPRLREMLFAQGMNLTQADVSGGSARDPSPTPLGGRSATQRELDSGSVGDTEKRAQRSVGLLDLYA